MEFPSILQGFPIAYSHLSDLKRGIGWAFGHVWKMIHQMPLPLYQIAVGVSHTVKNYFTESVDPKNPQLNPHSSSPIAPTNLSTQNDIQLKNSRSEDKTQRTFTEIENVIFDLHQDPLSNMGAIASSLSDHHIPSLFIQDISENGESGMNALDNEILKSVQDIVKPAHALLETIALQKPDSLSKYLDLTKQIEEELEILTVFASKFVAFPKGHELVQSTLKNLENKTRLLEREMCAYVKCHYKPNPKIGSGGHCLFESIQDQLKNKKNPKRLKNKKNPKYYRELAANHIRQHVSEFKWGVLDAMGSKQVENRLLEYEEAQQEGKKSWNERLAEKLGREPTDIDFYCDCLENSNLWGGAIEVLTLSEELQVPILIFTRQDCKTWRFDLMVGVSKFKDKSPLLLYYNGLNHYQSLIPRK